MSHDPHSWFRPSENLMDAVRTIFSKRYMPWDKYYLTMAQADFLDQRHDLFATKTYFIREAPFGGQYAVLSGLTEFVRQLEDLEFDESYRAPLKHSGCEDAFIDYLIQKKRLRLKIHSLMEGSLFFAQEPAIVLEGDLVSIRLAEGMLLPCINPASLFVTKWSRVNLAAAPGAVMDFSPRRAQNSDRASFYGLLGGCSLTSNSEMEKALPLVATGTMGHEYIQSYGDEQVAFDKWLSLNPSRPVLLVDTVDTLKSGMPHAIQSFKIHWKSIQEAGGQPAIRLDSGDLAYLTMEVFFKMRRELEKEQGSYKNIKIILTNDLDEYRVEEIKQQIFSNCDRSGFDPQLILENIIFACGTRPGTCHDQPSLGGVAKLSSIGKDKSHTSPVIKLSFDNPLKTSIPGSNRSALVWNKDQLICCVVYHHSEDPKALTLGYHPDDNRKTVALSADYRVEERHHLIYDSFDDLSDRIKFAATLGEVRDRTRKEILGLHWTHRRLTKAHLIKVSLSKKVYDLRALMIAKRQLICETNS